MSDLTAKFTALEEQLAAQAEVTDGFIDEVEGKLDLIFNTLDVMNVNNAANTKYLLAALSQGVTCFDCPPTALTPPVADGTVQPIDEDRCKRLQALLRFLLSYITVQNGLSAFAVPFNPSLLVTAFNQAITNIGIADTPPTPSFPEIVQLGGDLLSYTGHNLTVGGSLVDYWVTVASSLLTAMYASTTAAGAVGAYQSIINGSDLPDYVKAVFIDDGYAGAFNWYLDPANSPDLTDFDGDVCGGGLIDATECVDIAAILYEDSDSFFRYHIIAAPALSGNPTVIAGNFLGWTLEVISGTTGKNTDVYYHTGPTSSAFEASLTTTSGPHTITHANVGLNIFTDHDGIGTQPFTLRICPPIM